MLDSIYHMKLKLFKNIIFGVETEDLAIFYALNWTSLLNIIKSENHWWFIDFIAWHITPRTDVM